MGPSKEVQVYTGAREFPVPHAKVMHQCEFCHGGMWFLEFPSLLLPHASLPRPALMCPLHGSMGRADSGMGHKELCGSQGISSTPCLHGG